jgi:uncharacterized membrane protein
MVNTIGNPLSWSAHAIGRFGNHMAAATQRMGGRDQAAPELRDITTDDLRAALHDGWADFLALRSDVIAIAFLYPVIGALLAYIAFNADLLPYLFPLASGFALLGPAAATGLYELSRRREAGEPVRWTDSFAPIKSPSFGPILVLSLYLLGIFTMWMLAAWAILALTMGSGTPDTPLAFLSEVLTTGPGWAMIVIGIPVGAAFAALALAVSIVSFPLLIDRNVGLPVAVVTSLRVAQRNPRTVGLWGLIVASGLVAGSIPLFLGLIVVLPVLGHATWHLYRRAIKPV